MLRPGRDDAVLRQAGLLQVDGAFTQAGERQPNPSIGANPGLLSQALHLADLRRPVDSSRVPEAAATVCLVFAQERCYFRRFGHDARRSILCYPVYSVDGLKPIRQLPVSPFHSHPQRCTRGDRSADSRSLHARKDARGWRLHPGEWSPPLRLAGPGIVA